MAGMLRFSEDEFAELEAKRARRERFQSGAYRAKERDVLAGCLELLKRHPRVAWATRQNTGAGFVLDGKTYHALVKAGHLQPNQARFMRFGFVGGGDATGQLIGGARLEVECKSDTGRVSDDQQAVHEAVNAAGGLHLIVRSVDDLVRGLA